MKKYIRINAEFEQDGTMIPVRIIWDNGAEYPISEVIDVRYFKPESSGKIGIKYTCIILGKIRDVYFEDARWYVV
ncbi:MAG: hypothetical protein IJ598_02500 [Ruminococcus sp.]|nr:hypothetical protein [Ruminococcus sp.]